MLARRPAAEVEPGDQDRSPLVRLLIEGVLGILLARVFERVLSEPVGKRIRQLASLHTVSESVANRALVVYHLGSQRPMLEAFLTRLGIAHDKGMITDTQVTAPDPAALRDAANALAAAFPAGAVRLYLRTLAGQDPDTWGALAGIATELPAS